METFTHACIKPDCQNSYQDNEPDAYYCQSCQKEKERLAKQVDSKFQTRSRKKTTTALDEYNNAPKVHGFMHVKL